MSYYEAAGFTPSDKLILVASEFDSAVSCLAIRLMKMDRCTRNNKIDEMLKYMEDSGSEFVENFMKRLLETIVNYYDIGDNARHERKLFDICK